jgi:hypothetical protein
MTPLLVRRLRLDLRGPGGHLIRVFAAACLLFTIVAVVQSGVSLGSPGRVVYGWIVWLDSLLISVGSVTLFASIIAAEREEGTLPLIRLTGISPLALLLGQGFSGVVIGCFLLIVQIPFVILTITLGGVTWDQVLATFLALAAHLVLCAGLGLFWSVVCLRAGVASFYTLLSVVGLWLGTWFFRKSVNGLVTRGWITLSTETLLDSASVWFDERLVWSQLTSIASSFGVQPVVSPQFWWSLGAGTVLLVAGALLLDRRPLETPAYSPIVIRLWRSSGNRAWPQLAIAGKDFRQFMGGMKGFSARFLLYPLVPIGIIWAVASFSTNNIDADDTATTVFWFSAIVLTIEAAAVTARVFRNELVELTWSSLMVLPRWRVGVAVEKLSGCCLGLLPGLCVCVVAGFCSPEVRQFFIGPSRSSDDYGFAMLVMMQPVLWVSVTSLASMLLVAPPPTVTIFCGFLGIIFQYFFMLLCAFLLFGDNLEFKEFVVLYLIVTAFFCLACQLIALLRLRRLTEKS